MKLHIFGLVLLASCITGQLTLPQESGTISAFFCDQIDCEKAFLELAKNASSLNCAIYHPSNAFANAVIKQGELVVEGDHAINGAIIEEGSALMHHKFCIINESVVWTGSWNPAQRMSIANNVVVIESKTLARAYDAEFSEMQTGIFHRGKTGSARLLFNGNLTEAYFCPEDNCAKRVQELLQNANSSIHVMAYSFTDDVTGSIIAGKANAGLNVQVMFNPAKDDRSSEYPKLKDFSRIAKLHHKVFIIDNSTVITGSMNPTKNGDERNDENIIILRDSNVAAAFEREFERLWAETAAK